MNNIAILVNSCDAYSDLWNTFFWLLKLNWKDVDNYSIYLNTESIKEFEFVLPVTIVNTELNGDDKWGKRVLNSLSRIKEEFVIVLMDDFFLRSSINEKQLLQCLEYFRKDPDVAVFYLTHVFSRDFKESNLTGFGIIPKFTNYRLNSGPGLWRKSKLANYIEENDNPWAWEYFGTCRTNYTNDKFFCCKKEKPVYDYAHAIYRGKWLEKEMKPLIERYSLDIDMSRRGMVTENEVRPKRSFSWKLNFILTGVRMVGLDAIKEIVRDKRNAH